MSNVSSLHAFLTTETQKTAEALIHSYRLLPADKRDWSPAETARTALDLFAECALLNAYTTEMIETRAWSDARYANFVQDIAEVKALGEEALFARLRENTQTVIAALREVPEEALGVEIAMPWGQQTLAQIMAYPYWNMSYHQAQINYLASILGCLE